MNTDKQNDRDRLEEAARGTSRDRQTESRREKREKQIKRF